MLNDTDMNDNVIKESNLIFVGNYHPDGLVAEIFKKIPITIENAGIFFKDRYYEGNINFVFIYPNPENQDKFVVIIGSNMLSTFRFSYLDFPTNGWYDYILWKNRGESAEIIDYGYF